MKSAPLNQSVSGSDICPVEYAGYALGPGLQTVQAHPQFAHLKTPPEGYVFQSTPTDAPYAAYIAEHLRHLDPNREPPKTSVPAVDHALSAITAIARAAMGYGATIEAVREFLLSRNVGPCLRIPDSTRLAFLPTFPFCLGNVPWVVEIEDTTTLFFPYLRNGQTASVDPRTLPCFPVLKALLESRSCRAILTHVQSTAKSVPLLFQSEILARKTFHVPMGVDVPDTTGRRRDGASEINLLFTNSWHQEAESFYLRGGHDVLEAFSILAERYPRLRLTIRSALPELTEKHRQLIQNHPRIRVVSGFVEEPQLHRLFLDADIYLLPAAHLHVVSLLKAMAYGIPVIASDGWGFNEYIEDGRTGFMVRGRNGRVSWEDPEHKMLREDYSRIRRPDGTTPDVVSGLVDTVSRLMDDRFRQQISLAARQSVEAQYTTQHWNRGLKQLFDSAVHQPSEAEAASPIGVTSPAGSARNSKQHPRVLLIPLEFMTWQRAKSWSYTGAMAIEEGLVANGAECFTLPAWHEFPSDSPDSLLAYARGLCEGKTFDQVWIWLTHNRYTDEFLAWVATLAPVRVGLTMESMEHTEEEYSLFPHLRGRSEFVAAQLRHMTHVLVADEVDAPAFRAAQRIEALWYPVMVPSRCVAPAVQASGAEFATFSGALYGRERAALLGHPALHGLLAMPELPEQNTNLPQLFDRAHEIALTELRRSRRCDLKLLSGYVGTLRQVRRKLFDAWLDGLRLGFASVNLPSVFKSYAGRVAESMAAGTAVVSWNTSGRPQNQALFIPGEEILLFDRADPAQLAAHLQRLKRDPGFRYRLAEAARKKILANHTAEIRTRQILDWIETGREPAFNTPATAAQHGTVPAPIINYCLKPGYQSRPVPRYFEDTHTAETGVTWQPDVYTFGANIARRLGCKRIIDVGCGRAQKLAQLQGEFDTIGIDYGSNLDFCRSRYGAGRWLEADFEQASPLSVSAEDAEGSVVICSDVIEHMIKPEALLAKIKQLLEHAAVAVISTPERDLTWGPNHMGPPPNTCHTREWNLAELQTLLDRLGMKVEYGGLTRSHDRDPARKTILLVVGNARGWHHERFARNISNGTTFGTWVTELNDGAVRVAAVQPAPAPAPSTGSLVSVVIPCYKQAEYLAESVDSVVAQTHQNWELIIVNDGSPDDTSAVARDLIKRHAGRRIRLVEQQNQGLAMARNAGIRVSVGKYILPLDADDRIHPDMLAKTVALLEANPGISIAYTDYRYFGFQEQVMQTREYDFRTICTAYNQFTCTSLYRREAWVAAGGYNPNMVLGYEDWDFWISCGELGYVGKRVPEVLFFYRTKQKSMISDAKDRHGALFARIILNHPSTYPEQVRKQAEQVIRASRIPELVRTLEASPVGNELPLVSICIPTYNGEAFIAETIASALAQTYPAIEIIISDDASSDRTLAIAEEKLNGSRVPVRILRHDRLGLVGNWQHCIANARGTYIKFLFQDDCLEPDCVAELVAVAKLDPAIGLVFSPRKIECRGTDSPALAAARRDAADVHTGWSRLAKIQPGAALLQDPKLLDQPINKVGEPTTVLLAKAAIEEVGGFDPDLRQLVDVEMWLRLMTRYKVGFANRVLSTFRLHEKQATQSNLRAGLIAEDWKRFYTKLATDPKFEGLPAAHRGTAREMVRRLSGAPTSPAGTGNGLAAVADIQRVLGEAQKSINEGRIPDAIVAMESLLKIAPDAEAPRIQQIISDLKAMAPSPAAPPEAEPKGDNFFGPVELANIETLLRTYADGSITDESRAQLNELQTGLAGFVRQKNAAEIEALFKGDFGRVYRLLLASGLQWEAAAEGDSNHAAGEPTLSADGLPSLLADMLLKPADAIQAPVALQDVPAGLCSDYVDYLLSNPGVFAHPGEAERYAAFRLVLMRAVRARIDKVPNDPVTEAVAFQIAMKASCIPLYCAAGNTREVMEHRGAILDYVLRRKGANLNATFPKRSKSRGKIKVGYLSAHFGPQTETHVTLSTLRLDRSKFEITLFALHRNASPLENECRAASDAFVLLPEKLADRVQAIRGAGLDVLIIGTNITAVTNDVALLAAYRLAPLQLASYCSPMTTGLRHVDGFITGSLSEFEGAADHFTEQLLVCDGPPGCLDYTHERAATMHFDRKSLGIAPDEVVFVNAASCYKILPELVNVWAKILSRVKNSRLLLLPFNPNWSSRFPAERFKRVLGDALRRHGVDPKRVVLAQSLPSRADVKELEKIADVYLDTYPFSGSLSVIDPLELGLPTLVWQGNTPRSRAGAALLREIEVPELIASDEAGYLAVAEKLGTDSAFRAELALRIRQRMKSSPRFTDAVAYGRELGRQIERLVGGSKHASTEKKVAAMQCA